MSERLQVILRDPAYRAMQRAARSRHMSIVEWVRQASSGTGDFQRVILST